MLFTYDVKGNIIKESFVSWNDFPQNYEKNYGYDALNQLTGYSDTLGNQYYFEYDFAGNITCEAYRYGEGEIQYRNYSYDNGEWKDKLTSYNGESITYDNIGNPLSYFGANLTWSEGRRLATYSKNGQNIAFNYDADGKRISKIVSNDAYFYTYNQGTLVAVSSYYNGLLLKFICDENGDYVGFIQNGVTYYYVRNLQNDVVGISDTYGNVLVTYSYDPWGKLLSIDSYEYTWLGELNPIRYRGYFYDEETGLYYLQSRYYNPEIGRFINADEPEILLADDVSLLQSNLYAYCWNNPVNMADDAGYLPWLIAAAVSGAVFDTVFYVIGSALTGKEITWAGVGKAALQGAITGVAFGAVGKAVKAVAKAVKTAKAVKVAKYTTGTANQIGKIGEKISGIVKNNTKFFVNGRYRIPDGITKKFVQEVKNVKSLSLTSQLKDSIQLAHNMGKRLQLFIRPDTYLSAPLKQAINEYGIKVTYLW